MIQRIAVGKMKCPFAFQQDLGGTSSVEMDGIDHPGIEGDLQRIGHRRSFALFPCNMTELADELQTVTLPQGGTAQVGGRQMEGLPEGFKEGPFAFKRDGWYYLTFPWVRKQNGTETLAYAMSRSPLGPWDFKGIFMAEHANRCWTNHHSFLYFRGEWYLFYHHNDYSPRMGSSSSRKGPVGESAVATPMANPRPERGASGK